ncbi:PE domain-containing protein [Mycobacterium asiaticum]|nr:PE domain-containing protein [Mycobacterium asiaticum]
MSYVLALPEVMSTAATDVASIGSAIATANQGVASATTEILAAAEDEVSAAIASLFSGHGRGYQALSAQAAAFNERFAQALTTATSAYASAEAASAAPLAALENLVLGVQQLPRTLATGFESLLSSPQSPFLALVASDIPPLSWLAGNSPPPLLNLLLGQTVQYTTYDGMSVVRIIPANPTGEHVVAIHGGAFIFPPSIFHWLNYSVTSYMTGATFEVPIYPLLQEGGTAPTVVPKIAGLISQQIAQYGSANVSVTGDSAGGNLALAAVQHMLQLNPAATVPSSIVLISPWLDVGTRGIGSVWAGGLPITNYQVSPLYGSLTGLPPTYVYSGSFDPLAAQAAILQQAAAVTTDAKFNFVLFPGGIHDWVLLTPFGLPYWPQINRELGIAA